MGRALRRTGREVDRRVGGVIEWRKIEVEISISKLGRYEHEVMTWGNFAKTGFQDLRIEFESVLNDDFARFAT